MIRRGDIYWIKIPHYTGFEIAKDRPGVIVGAHNGGSVLQVVFVSSSARAEFGVPLRTTGRSAVALTRQITAVDKSRLGEFIGRVKGAELRAIDAAILETLGLRMPC